MLNIAITLETDISSLVQNYKIVGKLTPAFVATVIGSQPRDVRFVLESLLFLIE